MMKVSFSLLLIEENTRPDRDRTEQLTEPLRHEPAIIQ